MDKQLVEAVLAGRPRRTKVEQEEAKLASKRPARARWMTAATALVASTLTAPPGRSTLATVLMAATGESTYSRTLWHSTRSAP